MHATGLCHCDVRPSNILQVDANTPLLIDFAASVAIDARAPLLSTLFATSRVTQLREKNLNVQAKPQDDLISLCNVLYSTLPDSDREQLHGLKTSLSIPLEAFWNAQYRAAALWFRELFGAAKKGYEEMRIVARTFPKPLHL